MSDEAFEPLPPRPGPLRRLLSPLRAVLSWYDPRTWRGRGLLRLVPVGLSLYLGGAAAIGVWWSAEPAQFDVRGKTAQLSPGGVVTGSTVTATTIAIGQTLTEKRGGFLRNDVLPPGVWVDNIPEWEFGALQCLRDTSRTFRNHFSRSQTQSREDKALADAQTYFNNDAGRLVFPSPESQYRLGVEQLQGYLDRLADADDTDGQFFARADNLREFLSEANVRLGDYAERLAASVGEDRVNIDLAGDPNAAQSTPKPNQAAVRTSFWEVDNVFYEARGYTWALLHLLEAAEVDFQRVLEDKNAGPSLRQIINELRGAQAPLRSPIVLNGGGFGFFANHSLVLASYISRANAAMLDLQQLLRAG